MFYLSYKLPASAKYLKKIVSSRLTWFGTNNNFLSHDQFAFKKGQGTIDALLNFENFVSSAISSRNHVTVLALDFEKAYDRIGSHLVLRQLQKWKVDQKIYDYVSSFLNNRKIKCKTNGIYSEVRKLENGITQGSPLSVILLIAFEELKEIKQKYEVSCSIYADDVLFFTKGIDLHKVNNSFTNILGDISIWSH